MVELVEATKGVYINITSINSVLVLAYDHLREVTRDFQLVFFTYQFPHTPEFNIQPFRIFTKNNRKNQDGLNEQLRGRGKLIHGKNPEDKNLLSDFFLRSTLRTNL